MQRREVLHKCLGVVPLALAPKAMAQIGQASTGQNHTQFQEPWEEARISHSWLEYKRAYDLAKRAAAVAPDDLDNNGRADIVETLKDLGAALAAAEEDLVRQQEALTDEPDDPEKRFFLGFTLTRLGRDDEALVEYHMALRNPERLCAKC